MTLAEVASSRPSKPLWHKRALAGLDTVTSDDPEWTLTSNRAASTDRTVFTRAAAAGTSTAGSRWDWRMLNRTPCTSRDRKTPLTTPPWPPLVNSMPASSNMRRRIALRLAVTSKTVMEEKRLGAAGWGRWSDRPRARQRRGIASPPAPVERYPGASSARYQGREPRPNRCSIRPPITLSIHGWLLQVSLLNIQVFTTYIFGKSLCFLINIHISFTVLY